MQPKPEAAFWVSVIGGVLGVLAGAVLFGGILGLWLIIVNTVIAINGVLLHRDPESSHTWGIVNVILSFLAGLNVIALAGGILAITWKPPKAAVTIRPKPTVEHTNLETIEAGFFCRYCGQANKQDAIFCEKCGRKLK